MRFLIKSGKPPKHVAAFGLFQSLSSHPREPPKRSLPFSVLFNSFPFPSEKGYLPCNKQRREIWEAGSAFVRVVLDLCNFGVCFCCLRGMCATFCLYLLFSIARKPQQNRTTIKMQLSASLLHWVSTAQKTENPTRKLNKQNTNNPLQRLFLEVATYCANSSGRMCCLVLCLLFWFCLFGFSRGGFLVLILGRLDPMERLLEIVSFCCFVAPSRGF